MSYKAAYLLFLDGQIKVFAGNYEGLDDLKRDPDYQDEYFEKWWSQKDNVFYIRRRTEPEWREYRREHRAS